MFKIGEFSRLGQISVRMLRHYDDAGLLVPERIDPANGYRLYSGRQLGRLNRIIFLRNAGFAISEIAALLDAPTPEFLERRLWEKREEVLSGIRREEEKIRLLESATAALNTPTPPMEYPVRVKSAKGTLTASLRRVLPRYTDKYVLWAALYNLVASNGLTSFLSGETLGICHDDEYKETEMDLEACVMLTEAPGRVDGLAVTQREPVAHLASVTVFGPHENAFAAFEALALWFEDMRNVAISGAIRTTCHRGPWNESNPDSYITEIQIPFTHQ